MRLISEQWLVVGGQWSVKEGRNAAGRKSEPRARGNAFRPFPFSLVHGLSHLLLTSLKRVFRAWFGVRITRRHTKGQCFHGLQFGHRDCLIDYVRLDAEACQPNTI
jgi:hypothetical protein